MILTPLASHSPRAVRDALVSRGMESGRAEAAAGGLVPVALLFDDVRETERDVVAQAAQRHGIACLTGDGWVLLAGGAAQVAGLTRGDGGVFPASLGEELGQVLRGVVTPSALWTTARGSLSLDTPVVVGILNVTPDSFSDGGQFQDPGAAVAHAEAMLAAGARMLDIGGESTRPGRPAPVPAAEEWARLEPVLPELARRFPAVPLSVDTVKSEVAARALDAGAWAVNDVAGLRLDPAIADVCAARGAGLILMHSRGTTSDMATYDRAQYNDVASEVAHELSAAVREAEARGVQRERLVLDPGLGFAKRPEHNFAALRGVPVLAAQGLPVMVGPSRKRFLGSLTGHDVDDRDLATAAASAAAYLLGASLFRVHAVAPTLEALSVAHAIRTA